MTVEEFPSYVVDVFEPAAKSSRSAAGRFFGKPVGAKLDSSVPSRHDYTHIQGRDDVEEMEQSRPSLSQSSQGGGEGRGRVDG